MTNFDPHTVTPCQLIAWAMSRPLGVQALAVKHLQRIADTDSEYAGSTADARARRIAAGRARDLIEDIERISGGQEPETFCGRLNLLEFAAGYAGLSANARYAIFERGPLLPPL